MSKNISGMSNWISDKIEFKFLSITCSKNGYFIEQFQFPRNIKWF